MSDYEMPPPARRSSNYEPPTPMTNSDFRKMLETPRPRHAPTPSRQQQQNKQKPKQAHNDNKARKPPKPSKPSQENPEDEDDPDKQRYRDRAAERRAAESVGGSIPSYDHAQASILAEKGIGSDFSQISIEQSKYLGGDLEHTHLVKGLDYALLQKERIRVEKEQEQATKEAAKKESRVKKEDMQIHSSLARGVVDALFNPPRRDLKDMFLPRRTAFMYDFDPDDPWTETEIPTTLHRSKIDCPPVVETLLGAPDATVLGRISQLLVHINFSAGAKGVKKLKKREKDQLLFGPDAPLPLSHVEGAVLKGSMGPPPSRAPKVPSQPVDEDDDIFGDAGTDYKPKLPPKGATAAKKKDSYFDRKDQMEDIPMPASARPSGKDDDMEEGEVPPPPPPPPPSQHGYHQGGQYGQGQQHYYGPPVPPPPGPDGYVDPRAYEAYLQANVAYQASQDPEYQALLAKQRALHEEEAGGRPQQAGTSGKELPQQEKDAGMGSVFKRDEDRWKVSGKDRKVVDPDADEDAYAECYPNYHTLGAEVVDSDDEGADKMDGQQQKSRYDFDTEEEWQAYKSQVEANPKAAYQFGVKAGDGRQKHKSMEKQKEQKLNTQLHKIQGYLKEQGHDHDEAFRAEPRYSDDAPTPMRAKRMRI